MVFPLVVIGVTSPLLWKRGRIYRSATVFQAAFYGLGAIGALCSHRPLGRHKLLALPAFFCFVNAAALRASWNLVSGRRIDRWEPRRAGPASPTHEPQPDEAGALPGGERA
jgi:hypothetical protein